MEKEEVNLISQLLSSTKDALRELKNAQRNNDMERLASSKREILGFQKQIDKLLKKEFNDR